MKTECEVWSLGNGFDKIDNIHFFTREEALKQRQAFCKELRKKGIKYKLYQTQHVVGGTDLWVEWVEK